MFCLQVVLCAACMSSTPVPTDVSDPPELALQRAVGCHVVLGLRSRFLEEQPLLLIIEPSFLSLPDTFLRL